MPARPFLERLSAQESSKREPMADLLDKFDKIANVLGAKDPGISAGLKRLVEQAARAGPNRAAVV